MRHLCGASTPAARPVGKRVQMGVGGAQRFILIAGVVENVRHKGREAAAEAQIFVPESQQPNPNLNLAIHTRNDPGVLATAVRSGVWSLDKEEPVYDMKTMESRISEGGMLRRVETLLLTAFALLALCLAGHWCLRRSLRSREPAYARDRRPHGSGRGSEGRSADGDAAQFRVDYCGNRGRLGIVKSFV